MATAFFLDEFDRDILRVLIARERARLNNVPGRESPDDDQHENSAVYVVKIPTGGIPALSGTAPPAPGAKDCDVYEVLGDLGGEGDPRLVKVDQHKERVYNVTDSDAPENKWFPVARAADGHWLILQGGGGAGGATGCARYMDSITAVCSGGTVVITPSYKYLRAPGLTSNTTPC